MTDNDDDLEKAYSAPVTGRQVGAWTLDILEELYAQEDPAQPLSSPSREALARLIELGEPERVMVAMLQTATTVLHQVHMETLISPAAERADQIIARGFLGTRSTYRGDGPI